MQKFVDDRGPTDGKKRESFKYVPVKKNESSHQTPNETEVGDEKVEKVRRLCTVCDISLFPSDIVRRL